MLYLPEKDWSSRFGPEFFTVSLDSRRIYEIAPEGASNSGARHRSHPAMYFVIKVKCANCEKLCPRRYSQFRQLYDEILKIPKLHRTHGKPSINQSDLDKLHFPPKTCLFTNIDEEFLDTREDELLSFLDDLLKIANCSEHQVVRDFLDLDKF
jgi:hypothetical protein